MVWLKPKRLWPALVLHRFVGANSPPPDTIDENTPKTGGLSLPSGLCPLRPSKFETHYPGCGVIFRHPWFCQKSPAV
eukprot:9713860-Lingulodinium_polyedra.AAC.1